MPASGWLAAFVLTVAVEVPVVVLILRRSEPDLRRLALLVLFANLATHPIVWYVISQPFLIGTPAYLLVAEAWAIGAEAVFYVITVPLPSWRPAAAAAGAANVASFLVGQLVVTIWPGALG
jgi:hypothetical protein